ncbi:YvcK family protein [Candidatus Roizmanbacteria bacterium]|nr:YvcK family protein [Candidatus Roizmanbacteria bacterium]
MKIVTVIGGGTGTFVVLSGLKKYPIDLGAIVTMMDSGGSTGRLRDQLGVLPPGDLRQCLVALSEAPILWRKLFLYRFESGDFAGHNFGNLFLSALEKVSSNYDEVMNTAAYVLKTKGKVIPVTFDKTHLCVEYEGGKTVVGEHNIEENIHESTPIKKAYLSPPAKPNNGAINRLKESDTVIIGPGDLYTSIIPVLLVNKVKETLQNTKAKIIFIMNLMTKSGQTNNYKASNHVCDLSKYLGKEPQVVILNSGKILPEILQWYKDNNEKVVENDLVNDGYKGQIIVGDLIDSHRIEKAFADKLTRSILRHDSTKLASVLKNLIL